jgi:signal transduction histidine kinase
VNCADGVRLEILNHPPAAGVTTMSQLGSGNGLTGLAERAAAIGGTIDSGPVQAGGWRLSAALPVTT